MSNDLFKALKGDFFEFYPSEIQTSPDPEFRILANKVNSLTTELVTKNSGRDLDLTIEDLDRFYIPEQSPEKILPYIANMVGYDYDASKTVRESRQIIFNRMSKNKKTGTFNFLLDSIEEITGVRPTYMTGQGVVSTGWDQDSSVDGNPENVDFMSGIGWDQTGTYIDSTVLNDFRWFVKTSISFLDIKNDGVFDLDTDRNSRILQKVYDTVAKYKDAAVALVVGYVDSTTGTDVALKYVYSRDIISNTEILISGYVNNPDSGIEF